MVWGPAVGQDTDRHHPQFCATMKFFKGTARPQAGDGTGSLQVRRAAANVFNEPALSGCSQRPTVKDKSITKPYTGPRTWFPWKRIMYYPI